MFIPIFMPIRGNSALRNLHTCSNCGHIDNLHDSDKRTIISRITVALVTVLMLSVMLLAVDIMCFNSMHSNHIFYVNQCDYAVPEDWSIDTDGKHFAVRYKDTDEYLYMASYGITKMHSSIAEPSKFFTECKAKAFLKCYIDDNKPRASNFKPVD